MNAGRHGQSDILFVSTGVDEDTAEHLRWHRDAAPQVHIVGLAFNAVKEAGLRDLGTVVSAESSRAKVMEVLQQVDRDTPVTVLSMVATGQRISIPIDPRGTFP